MFGCLSAIVSRSSFLSLFPLLWAPETDSNAPLLSIAVSSGGTAHEDHIAAINEYIDADLHIYILSRYITCFFEYATGIGGILSPLCQIFGAHFSSSGTRTKASHVNINYKGSVGKLHEYRISNLALVCDKFLIC